MFNWIKRGVEDMSKTVTKIIESIEKGLNSLKEPHTRRVVGVVTIGLGVGLGAGLLASSYV